MISDKYKEDRIFLDFNLGMTYSQFDEHREKLSKKDIARTQATFDESKDFILEFNFISDINGRVYQDDIEYNQIDDDKDLRLTKMGIQIFREVISRDPYATNPNRLSMKSLGRITPTEKKEIVKLFIEKYGEPQAPNSKDLIWAFPSVLEPKYICRLDTSSIYGMYLSYQYNDLFLQPIIEEIENKELNNSKKKAKNAI